MKDELPNRWEWATLGDVARWGSGGTPKKSNPGYYGGDIPWAVIGDLNDGVVQECAGSITQLGLEESSCNVVEAGTLLIAMYGSIGKLGIAGRPMATNQAIAFAQPVINGRYLFYYLMSQRSALGVAGKGATQQNISQTILKAWPIPVPPQPEQEWIADAIEEHLSRLDVAAESVKRCALHVNQLQSQLLASELGSGTQDDVYMGDLLTDPLANGRSVPTASGEGFPVLRLTCLRNGSIDTSETKSGDWGSEDPSRFLIRPRDFLISRGNGSLRLVGRGGLVAEGAPPVAFPDTLIRARVDEDRVHPDFLRLVWHSRPVRRQIESQARTTAGIYKINQSMIEKVVVPVPGLERQVEVVDRMKAVDAVVHRLTADLDHATALSKTMRRAILAAAFSGAMSEETEAAV